MENKMAKFKKGDMVMFRHVDGYPNDNTPRMIVEGPYLQPKRGEGPTGKTDVCYTVDYKGSLKIAREADMKKVPASIGKKIDVRIEISEVIGKQNVSFIRISDKRLELTGFTNVAEALDWNKKNDECNTYGLKYRIVK